MSIPVNQYTEVKLAELYNKNGGRRPNEFYDWLCDKLKKYDCQNVLDAACGTGNDSMVLSENGYRVTSTDDSQHLLKYALEKKSANMMDKRFHHWVIEKANWLTLVDDLNSVKVAEVVSENGFDAVLCMGSSFPHLPDEDGDQKLHKTALDNFYSVLKPGGILIIDHRNFETILKTGQAPRGKTCHSKGRRSTIRTVIDREQNKVILEYTVYLDEGNADDREINWSSTQSERSFQYSLIYYPLTVKRFTELLKSSFGSGCKYELFADLTRPEINDNPAYYHHIIQKSTINDG